MAKSTKPQTKSKLILPICLWAISLVPASMAQVPGTPTMWHVRNPSVPTLSCTGLNGGTWVNVPGNSIYGTNDFCVQKYVPTNSSGTAVAQSGSTPWVSISQTSAKTSCSNLGTGYHLITNPEWMTIAANSANVGSNWSGGSVGSGGELTRGHTDNSPAQACAADASDANAWVDTNCTGSTQSTQQFRERRTRTLSNGSVIWDFGGNVWQWVDYNNLNDKPNPQNAWVEYPIIIGSTTTPKSHLVPLNSVQSWWNNGWNSAQSIGQINPGTNGSGGALRRGGDWDSSDVAGLFTANLGNDPSYTGTDTSFRCAYSPPRTVSYNLNGGSAAVPPATTYTVNSSVTVANSSPSRTGFTFAGWNTALDGTGTTYAPGSTFTMGSTDLTLYARWWNGTCGGNNNSCYSYNSYLAAGTTATTPTSKSVVLTNGIWIENVTGGTKVLNSNGLDQWAHKLNSDGRSYDTNSYLDKANVAGRVCPSNVYIDDNNKFTTNNCLYYTPSLSSQTLSDLDNWNTAKWYVGNIQACSSKGMRLPTLYETTANQPSATPNNLPPADGTPTVWGGTNGVPGAGTLTWTATAYTMNTGAYFTWNGTSNSSTSYSNSAAVRCVVP